MFCSHCGKVIPPGETKCPACSAPLTEEPSGASASECPHDTRSEDASDPSPDARKPQGTPPCGQPGAKRKPQGEQKKDVVSESLEVFMKVLKTQYCCFEGRMSMREYWLFEIPLLIIEFILGILLAVPIILIVSLILGVISFVISFILTLVFPFLLPLVPLFAFFAGFIVGMIIYYVICLPFLLPQFGTTARRLHDTGKSGWFQLLQLIPIVGMIIVIILCCIEGQKESNKYGEVPAA